MGINDGAFATSNGMHVASVFRAEEEQFASAVPFILGGLDRGEKVVYVMDRHNRAEVVEALMKVRDVQGALDAHRIEFFTSGETYLRGGSFSPARMISLLESLGRDARSQGFVGLRGAGEMTWHTSNKPGSESLMEYEARLNTFCERSSTSLMCQYDEASFDAGLLLDVARTHPRMVVRGELCWNPCYISPEHFLSGMKGAVQRGVFERACSDMIKRTRLGEIQRLELRDVRRVSRRMSVLSGPALDDVQSQLSIMSFYAELALEAIRDPSAKEYVLKMADTCSSMQRRLDFIRSYQAIGESEPRWLDIAECLEVIGCRAGMEAIHIESSVGHVWVYADPLLGKALELLISGIPGLERKGDRVFVGFSETGTGGLLHVQHEGKGLPDHLKSRIFECGYRYGGCEGFDLYLAREIMSSTGITLREAGTPGTSTRFEAMIPSGKYSREKPTGRR